MDFVMLLASTPVEGWINRDKPGNDKTVDFDLKLAPMGTSPVMTIFLGFSLSEKRRKLNRTAVEQVRQ